MGKKKINPKELLLTYTGVLEYPNEIQTNILDELMRKFQSSKRFSHERIFQDMERKEVVEITKDLFISNSRYMRDAFLEAESTIDSQKELIPIYIEQKKLNINQIEKQIKKLETSKKKHKEEIITYKQSKIKKLEKQIRYYQYHIEHDTVPKVVHGGKKKLELLNKGKITIEEWRDLRNNAIYSRGEKSRGGNENMKLSHLRDNLFELRILNPLSGKKGDRLTFKVRFPEKFSLLLLSYLETKEAYSVRIIRRKNKYEVHVSLNFENNKNPTFENGMAGIDINPDNLSVTIVYPNGNFKISKVFCMHEVNTVSSNKRDFIIQNTIKEAIKWIKSFGINTIAIENLSFLQTNTTKKFNRISSNFSYSSMIQSFISACFKENIALIQVDAYYSSLIGKLKYQKMYGLSIHQSAAFVLARRALGFKETVPKELVSALFTKEVKKGHEISDIFKHWKKVKTWHDEVVKEISKTKLFVKEYFLVDLIEFKKTELLFK